LRGVLAGMSGGGSAAEDEVVGRKLAVVYRRLPQTDRVGGVVAGPSSHTTGHAGPHPAVHDAGNARYLR